MIGTRLGDTQGSPPRMRGKGPDRQALTPVDRITPAHAGKRFPSFLLAVRRWDHPRACGEKLYCFLLCVRDFRITPAHAGKRRTPAAQQRAGRDHPRVCGEKTRTICVVWPQTGSPPRVRGKGTAGNDGAGNHGITPACAGKRMGASEITMLTWDHPRVCGEKRLTFTPLRTRWGSPPRVRGKATDIYTIANALGITPACAGKSCFAPSFFRLYWDHPRVCGEKRLVLDLMTKYEGSPPRVRGKVNVPLFPDLFFGITPAHAGKRN